MASSAKNKEPLSASGFIAGFDLRILLNIPFSWHQSQGSIIDREVKLPAQAADDTVVRCAGGKIVQFVLREGDGVDARADVPVLQVEPQCDVQLSLFVLNDSQIFQVALQKPIQRFQLVGVQQAVVNCSMENTRM